ncbi:MAG: Crp/Fnr family transcriptional regulator [Bacteroidetes bacterium]|nr:Crp/Fnr family transcriptional regulator [Bacteroidota bacterium]
MFTRLINLLKNDTENWEKNKNYFREMDIPSKTALLNEGEISKYMYFIKKGCLRMWFNNDGKDITFQFFFENQAVASIESFYYKIPGIMNLQSIEPSTLVLLHRDAFEELGKSYPELKEDFFEIMLKRLSNYSNLFLSRIKDTPRKRYEVLLKEHPEIVQRVPQHYIASYLGITPISLSRIRNRI